MKRSCPRFLAPCGKEREKRKLEEEDVKKEGVGKEDKRKGRGVKGDWRTNGRKGGVTCVTAL